MKPFRLGDRSIDNPHSFAALEEQVNGGKMNGFVDAVGKLGLAPDPSVMGYYDRRDLPYHWKAADNYVLFDRWFQSAAAGSVPNHMYWATGTVGNPNGLDIPRQGFDMTTIFDRLEERGISWKFYVKDYDPRDNYKTNEASPQVHWVPLLSFDRYIHNPRLFRHIVDMDEYFEDLQNGTLPSVAFMVPSGGSEHPPGNLQGGQRFVGSLVNGLMQSRYWNSSAFMWSYDDWGGWFDHVRPPKVDKFGYGFRVPTLLVSPYARRGHIDHTTLDFTSALKFIEDNWDLKPLAKRDASAANITSAFDFSRAPRSPRILTAAPQKKPSEPNRLVIYSVYGTALAFTSVVIFLTLLGSILLRRRGGPPKPPPSRGGRFARGSNAEPSLQPAGSTVARAVAIEGFDEAAAAPAELPVATAQGPSPVHRSERAGGGSAGTGEAVAPAAWRRFARPVSHTEAPSPVRRSERTGGGSAGTGEAVAPAAWRRFARPVSDTEAPSPVRRVERGGGASAGTEDGFAPAPVPRFARVAPVTDGAEEGVARAPVRHDRAPTASGVPRGSRGPGPPPRSDGGVPDQIRGFAFDAALGAVVGVVIGRSIPLGRFRRRAR